MRYEDKFLVDMCKATEAISQNISYDGMDWDYLLKQAIAHEVVGFLYKPLWGNRRIPRYINELIEAKYYYQKQTGFIKIREFHNVIKKIQEQGVTAVILKGMYLVPELYCDTGLRSFGDLDILVDITDITRVDKVLRSIGYVQGKYNSKAESIQEYSPKKLKQYADNLQHEAEYVRKLEWDGIGYYFCKIDVHKRINTYNDGNIIPVSDLLDRSVEFISKYGGKYRRLSNEDMLVHLCYHNYWHTQSLQDIFRRTDASLKLYTDIRTCIKYMSPDIRKAMQYAQVMDILLPVQYSLYFTQKLFGDVLSFDNIKYLGDINAIEKEGHIIRDRWIAPHQEIGKFECDYLTRMFDYQRFAKIDLLSIKAKYENVQTSSTIHN